MFPAHTIDSAPGAHEAMLGVQRKFGGIPPVVARLANAPHLLNTFLVSSAAVEASSLPPIAREVVIMMVAVRNDCEVCIGIHSSALRRLGREDLTDALMAGRELTEPELAAVQRFVHRIYETSGQVGDADLAAFRSGGYSPENALDIVLAIGVYTMSTFANRMVGS